MPLTWNYQVQVWILNLNYTYNMCLWCMSHSLCLYYISKSMCPYINLVQWKQYKVYVSICNYMCASARDCNINAQMSNAKKCFGISWIVYTISSSAFEAASVWLTEEPIATIMYRIVLLFIDNDLWVEMNTNCSLTLL